MPKIIVGLGNGKCYKGTRHNIGEDILASLKDRDVFRDEIEALAGEKVFFVPTEGYYNTSGEYIGRKARFYKIDPAKDLLIICDDFYLEFGTMRLRLEGSDGGNKGLKSIIKHLGTSEFARLRLGTDNGMKQNIDAEDFVLSKFNSSEIADIPKITKEVEAKIKEWLERAKNSTDEQ